MESYSEFAQVYDLFMDNVPYKTWGNYIGNMLKEFEIKDGLVLDLGCGTGKMTRILSEQGYDMIGIDSSEEMLMIAREQMEEQDSSILYLEQDMRNFELYGTVRAVVSACDCLNYLLTEEDLRQVFSLVNNYLDPKGIFLFDMNTIYKYKELLGDATICENREEGSFIWENYYDEETGENEYDLTLYIKEKQGLYGRYEETHIQRGYEQFVIEELLRQAGMEVVAVYDAYTKERPHEKSERLTFIAREHGKKGE